MFIDTANLTLVAGKGGNGVSSFRRERYIPKGGPNGGDGGIGGSIWIETNENLHSLDHFQQNGMVKAENGRDGSSGCKKGRSGADTTLQVPTGTLIHDQERDELLFDLDLPGQKLLLCKGGGYGRGNKAFTTSKRRAPNHHTFGKEGEVKKLSFELKSIADVGLVGFPNAGKSTFLNLIAQRKVKTASYPFTTLKPNLGIVSFDDYSRICFADIPGIIEGASKGKGLGLEFLRHIERCSVYLFILDVSEKNWMERYETLKEEMESYNPALLQKPHFIALNKVDLIKTAAAIPKLKDTFLISAKNQQGILDLILKIRKHLPKEALFRA